MVSRMNDDDDEDDDDDHHHHDGNLYSAMPPLFTLRMLTALRENFIKEKIAI